MSVTLNTTHGPLKLELFCSSTPKTSENFLALCASSYYSSCKFHRIIPGFMAQTGDPTHTGKGGESIWGAPFGNEIKSHLKHNARGALGMANKGRDGTNGSQFYITFGKQTHLDGKNTVFGKLIDGFETLDAIERIKVDEKGKPEVDVVILDVTIHANPLAT